MPRRTILASVGFRRVIRATAQRAGGADAGDAAPEPPGMLRFGSLRRVSPISDSYGLDRGTPIDRYYIDGFLERYAADIGGRVLEVNDDRYTQRFGGGRVERSDVIHPIPGNPAATLIADLADAPHVPDGSFDCVICTQTLLYIFDTRAAIRTLRRILSPGGVLLVTVPGICRLSSDNDEWGDWWRFTTQSIARLFDEAFEPGAAAVEAHGNVLAAAAQLYGLAAEELTPRELDHRDPAYDVVLAVRAQTPRER